MVIEQKGALLNKLNLSFVKDITCYLFNDGLLIAYRVKRHFPFTRLIFKKFIVPYYLFGWFLNSFKKVIKKFQKKVSN